MRSSDKPAERGWREPEGPCRGSTSGTKMHELLGAWGERGQWSKEGGGGALGGPRPARWSRMALMILESVMVVSTRMRPPHSWHSRDVDANGAAHEVGPGPVAGWGGVGLGGGIVSSGCWLRLSPVAHDGAAVLGVGGEDAMVEHEVDTWARDEGGETADELVRGEVEVGGAIAPRVP